MSDTTDNCVTLNQTVFVVKEKDTTVWEPTLGGNGGFSVSVLQTLNSPRQVVILSATLDGIAIDIEDTATSGSLVVVKKELEVAANIEQLVTMGLVIEQGTFVLQAVEEVNGNERLLASVTQQAGDVTGDAAAMHTQSMQLQILPNTGNIKLRLSSIPLTMGNRSKATGKWITQKIKYLEQENIAVTLCDSTADRYRFGFNGQEKVNEIAGLGNHNTAEFWEYDTRLGRRWNLDPIIKPWESGYATFRNNPILFIDINGDDGTVSGNGTKDNPYIITAYYETDATGAELKALNSAINEYNKGNVKGENIWRVDVGGKEDKKTLYAKFNLKIIEKGNESNPASHVGEEENIYRVVNKVVNYPNAPNPGKYGYSNTNGEIGAYTHSLQEFLSIYNVDINYDEALLSVYIHEIGHNLGGVHNDPGSTMTYFTASDAKTKENMTGSASSISGSNNGPSTITLSKVDVRFIRAILGRIDQHMDNNQSNSIYLKKNEKNKVQEEFKTGQLKLWTE